MCMGLHDLEPSPSLRDSENREQERLECIQQGALCTGDGNSEEFASGGSCGGQSVAVSAQLPQGCSQNGCSSSGTAPTLKYSLGRGGTSDQGSRTSCSLPLASRWVMCMSVKQSR